MEPQLDITTQKAEFEIITHKAKVEITTRRPSFRMRRDLSKMSIDRQLPVMHVDRTQMQTALGMGPVLQAARQYFHDSFQQGIDAIGDIAADGTAMLQLENGGDVVVELAQQATDVAPLELNTGALPPAEIYWDPGYLNINWTPGSFQMEWDVSVWADIRVEPHYVEIRMVKYPEIRVRVTYNNKHTKPGGKYVDKYL